jgi:hypothetical protein
MDGVVLTASHWIYLLFIVIVVITMVLKRDVVLPCLIGIFIIGLLYAQGSVVSRVVFAVQSSFNALMIAGMDLFDIMLVIALMVAMLKAMQKLGSDYLMVSPARKLMVNPHLSFFALGSVMYVCALFFWPTPATALVGVMLIPVAVKAGLPPMAAAMAVNIFGHGIALSGDLVIQGAPGLSERSAGLASGSMLGNVAILSWVTGIVAILVAYFMMRKEITINCAKVASGELAACSELVTLAEPKVRKDNKAMISAIVVPAVFISIIILMISSKFIEAIPHIRGGDATALLGGAAVAMLIFNTILEEGHYALESLVGHLREGMGFAIKIFTPVIPIAGFFFLGAGAAADILGEGAPRLLFDLGTKLAASLPMNKVALSFGNMFIGVITGLDGSGFSGLPLTASLAQSIGGAAGVSVPAMAAIGQMGAVWSGGGTIAAWAFGLVATAGVAGVNPLDLARKNFIPVACGLTAASIVAVFML